MKKVISLLLSTVMLVSTFASVDLSAYAVDSTDGNNFDIQDYFDNYQNKADDFNYLQYVSQYYTSDEVKSTIEFRINQDTNCNNLVGYLNSNLWFQGSYAIWETATFVTNPVDTIEKQLNKETYYETIILRILNSSVTSDNAIDWLNQGAIKNSIKISKNITQASETEYYAYLANKHLPISDFTDEEYNKTIEFTKNYINSQNYKKFGKDVSFIYDVLSISKDIEEYSERLASYCQLIELGDSIADFLYEIKNNSDNNDLIKAIDNVVPIIRDSHSDMLKTAAKEGIYCIGSFALKKIVGDTWKNCLINLLNNGYLFDGTAIVGSVYLAIGITKTFANIAFSTDAKLDKYELMKALCSFEQSMEAAMHRKINTFENTDKYANILLEGVSIVYQTYIIDTEVYSEMTRICQNDWIGNLSRDEYEKIIDICNYNKELYQNEYDSLKIVSGVCGDTLGWIITFDKELLIYGIGEMYDFEKEKAPWYDYKDRFNNLHISKLTTVLGGYAFYNCDNIVNNLYLDHKITIRWECFDNINSDITIISKEDIKFYGSQNISYKLVTLKNAFFNFIQDEVSVFNNEITIHGNLSCYFEHKDRYNTINTYTPQVTINSYVVVYGDSTFYTDDRGHIIASTLNGTLLLNPSGEFQINGSFYFYGFPGSDKNYQTDTYMNLYIRGKLTVEEDCYSVSTSKMILDKESSFVKIFGNLSLQNSEISNGELCVYGNAKNIVCSNIAKCYLYGEKLINLKSSEQSEIVLRGNGIINIFREDRWYATYLSTLIIENQCEVVFGCGINISTLFNHNKNSFTLYNDGKASYFPDYDGDGYNDNVDPYPLIKHPDEHDYIFSKTVEPTCVEKGYDAYICPYCNNVDKRNLVDMIPHNYICSDTILPTCTVQGYDLYTCSVCNSTEKRNIVSSTGHSYEVTSNTATCTEAGIKTSVCSKCGDTTTAEVSALGHSYNKVYTAPTCIESGGYTNTCIRCGDVVYDVYEKNGHDYGECIGEDYINTIYNTEGKFIESISSSVNYYGKTYYTTSYIGNSIMRRIKITYPQQIRIDINDKSTIENYNFYVKRYLPSTGSVYLNYIFSYNQNTGRSPDQSAIPYTDKNGNLINMKYIDYKQDGVWNNGEYLVENNNIIDVNGSVVSSSFSDTRPHIVYTKEEALENGIMNNDGTVNVRNLFNNEITFSSGVDGIYATIFNTYANSYVSALKCDDNVVLNAGVYNIPLCFYNSNSYATGNLLIKIYDKSKLQNQTVENEYILTCIDCGENHTEICDRSTIVAALNRISDYSPDDYSEESLAILQRLYDKYKYMNDSYASQEQIDSATNEILTAITELVPYMNLDISAPNGTFTVAYDGETNSNNSNSLLFGTNVTVSATANEGYRFVGWYDTVNNLYFNKNAEYSFKITTNTSLTAVFVEEQSATLTFTTYSNWVQSTVTKTIDEWNDVESIDELLPVVPYRYGYSNGRWVYDNAEVLAKLQAGENVSLIPEYDKDDTSLPTPPSPDGDTPVLDLYYNFDAGANVGSFVMAAGIPENCQIESVGIAFYYKDAKEFDPTKFELLINNKMLTGRFNTDEIDDIYIINLNNMTARYNFAARGYVTYYNADGVLKTVYSNQVNIVNREQV